MILVRNRGILTPGMFGVAAGGGDGTLSVVQQVVQAAGNGANASLSVSSCTSGNFLVCMTATGGTTSLGTSPTDNIGGAWTTALSQNTTSTDIGGHAIRFRIHHKVAQGGETTLTFTGTWDASEYFAFWEISKSAGTFSVDGTPDIGTGTGATSWGPETGITLAGDKSMICMMGVSSQDPTLASPYNTNAVSFDNTGINYGAASYANTLTDAQTLSSVFSSTSTGWIAGAIGVRAS